MSLPPGPDFIGIPHTTLPIGGTLVRRNPDGTTPGVTGTNLTGLFPLHRLGIARSAATIHPAALWSGQNLAAFTATDQDDLHPFYLIAGQSITTLGVFLGVPIGATTARAAIYNNVDIVDFSDLYPGDLLVETGLLDTGVPGYVNSVIVFTAPYTGLYWGAVNQSAGGATIIGISTVPALAATILGTVSATGTAPTIALRLARAIAAFPDPYPNLAAARESNTRCPFFQVP